LLRAFGPRKDTKKGEAVSLFTLVNPGNYETASHGLQ